MIAPDVVKSVRPGIYRVEWEDGGSSVAAVYNDRHGRRWLAPTNWIGPGLLAGQLDAIKSLRPLERQGGISGAMYWGDAIR